MGGSTSKAAALIAEIAAASQEQTKGIEQVVRAINEIDRVIQNNSANAEETSAVSEEVNAQVKQMRVFVGDLVSLVGIGEKSSKESGAGRRQQSREPNRHVIDRVKVSKKRNGYVSFFPKNEKEVNPERIIPLE